MHWSVMCDDVQVSDAFSEVSQREAFALALTLLTQGVVRVVSYNHGHSVVYNAQGDIIEGGW